MDPFVGEIKIFGGNFAPRNWAFCNGQLLPISQNTALFSLLGTTYGGDGKSTFALPNLSGRAPVHPDNSTFYLGSFNGSESVTLLTSEMPAHTHAVEASAAAATVAAPGSSVVPGVAPGGRGQQGPALFGPQSNLTALAPTTVTMAGGSIPFSNMQPYLGITFIIALVGIYPQRP